MDRTRGLTSVAIAVGLSAGLATAGAAAPPPLSTAISSQNSADGQPGFSGFLSDLNRSNYLLGDLFGLRRVLSRYGLSLAIQETSEALDAATGGVRRGADYDGLTQVILQLDTQRAFGWYGGVFNISALQLHGRNLSAEKLDTLQTASGIEGDRATRLWELWYDQRLLPEDRLDIRIGQQSADQEFIVTPNGAYFINTMFGWPLVSSVDLPGGGPAYPLSAPAIRFRYRPINPVAILLGVYSGSPVTNNAGDPQQVNPSGLSFPTPTGTLTFLELQYSYPALGGMAYPVQGAPLGHTYRIGAWYDSERFADQALDANGLSLAAPTSSGVPLQHHGDYSVYAVADQMVWRQADDPNRSVSLFGRAMDAPQGDRNLVDFSLNAGVVYHDPVANRADDTLAIGMGYAHVSHGVQAYDRALAADSAGAGVYTPIRTTETYVEATYQYQVHPWWQVQPDIQYVFNPGGGLADPDHPSQRIKNELVVGVRTNVLF